MRPLVNVSRKSFVKKTIISYFNRPSQGIKRYTQISDCNFWKACCQPWHTHNIQLSLNRSELICKDEEETRGRKGISLTSAIKRNQVHCNFSAHLLQAKADKNSSF
jgi:hypothetical protein